MGEEVGFVMLAAMRKARAKLGTVGIVGPGRLGSALVVNLARAGYTISFIGARSRTRVSSDTEKLARRVRSRIATLDEALLLPIGMDHSSG